MYEDLTALAQGILEEKFGVQDVDISWQRPQESSHGDLALPVALQLAKSLKKKPQDIAKVLVEGLSTLDDVEKAEVAGPGYVNIWLTPDALIKALSSTRVACTAKVTRKDEAPVIIEYSDPNIAKPLGVHHVLGTIIGQSVANLYRFAGYNVMSWNYIGDWGTQFGKLAVAYQKWGKEKSVSEYTLDELLELYVRFHDEIEQDSTLEDQGRAAFKKLEDGDQELRAFWEDVVSLTAQSLDGLYQKLHVSFDLTRGESFFEDKMEPVLEEGIQKKVFVEGKEGSLIVEFPEESNLPPYLVRKGDGATLYSTRDLAMMRYRIDTHNPKAIYIFTDIAQQLHFQQLEATCDQLEWELPEFENVLFGRMRFADQKMSTRKGNVLKLDEVLEEAVKRADAVIDAHGDKIQTDDRTSLADTMGVGSVAYGILSQNRKMDIVFDWDKMLTLEGNSAPYLQYTHARAKSVLRKANSEASAFPEQIGQLAEKERILMNTLLQLQQVLEEARENKMPHVLANYLYRLCQDYNSFYNSESILKAEEPQRSLRLALTELTAMVIKTGAELLTIRVPDRM